MMLRVWSGAVVALLLLLSHGDAVAQPEDGGGPVDTTGGAGSLEIESTPDGVLLLAKSFGDSVVLRWGPRTVASWLDGNRFGYIVEKVRIDKSSISGEVVAERLTPEPIIPWSIGEWERQIGGDTTKTWMAVAMQSLHGEAATPEQMGASENTYRAADLRATELANRHGFTLFAADQSAEAARGLALRLVDPNVTPEGRYAYRVYIAGLDTTNASRHDTGYALVNMADPPFDPTPVAVHAVGYDGAIRVAWQDDPLAGFSGYWIEREENSAWRRLNSIPVVLVNRDQEVEVVEPSDSVVSTVDRQSGSRTMSYVDSSIVNYQKYKYRVIGVDPFAELSEPVEVEGSGRDLTGLPTPQNISSEETGVGEVTIRWEMPAEVSGDLAGYRIVRGPSEEGPFNAINETLLPAGTLEHVVSDANEDEAYYSIVAIDTAGNETPSLVLLAEAIDRLPPAAPTGLRGRVDSSGMIVISWDMSPENDINGYKVFFSNDRNYEYSLLTNYPLRDTVYRDSLRIQNADKKIYYRVMALDRRLNQSPFSEVLELEQPDLVPPDAPAFRNIVSTDTSVILHWGRASAVDIEHQVVMRREAGSEGAWEVVARLDPENDSFEDREVVPEVIYHYYIYTEDNSGLRSEGSDIIFAGAYDITPPEGVKDLVVSFDRDNWQVRLSWNYSAEPGADASRIVVYRAGLEDNLERYEMIDPTTTEFVDASIGTEPVWKYAVRVETNEGDSRMSDVVVVPIR